LSSAQICLYSACRAACLPLKAKNNRPASSFLLLHYAVAHVNAFHSFIASLGGIFTSLRSVKSWHKRGTSTAIASAAAASKAALVHETVLSMLS